MISFVAKGRNVSCDVTSNIDLESDDFQSLINYLSTFQAAYIEGFKTYRHLLQVDWGVSIPVESGKLIEDYCNLVGWEFKWVDV